MHNLCLSLRWESTNDEWWFATPIDWAAANGLCDLVTHLLVLEPNLLIKLTSLTRIRRLESVWDDSHTGNEVARCRARVARHLFFRAGGGGEEITDPENVACDLTTAATFQEKKTDLENEVVRCLTTATNTSSGDQKNTDPSQCRARMARHVGDDLTTANRTNGGGQKNPLIRAGYSGWLLYTAASAGDVEFVKELLNIYPTIIFGEGEYGITDILYGAARSKSCEAFRILLNFAIDMINKHNNETGEGLLWEVMNRAVHSAARGGNLEILKELLLECSDVFVYRDVEGSSILHSASANGQIEVVKHLISTYDIVHSTDNQGNTALHVAAYRGYSRVVEVLALASPTLTTLRNNNGDTFLHLAVAGFLSPGFHRIDQQMELMKQLISNKFISLEDVINVRNDEGKTALHMAVSEKIDSNVIELLKTVPFVDINVRNSDGSTPRDLIKQCSKTAISNTGLARSVMTQSPGTCFRYPDADLFLYTGSDNDSEVNCERLSTRFSSCSSEPTDSDGKSGPLRSGSGRFKFLLQWQQRKTDRMKSSKEDNQLDLHKACNRNVDNTPTPLRQKFLRMSSMPNNRRGDFASPSTKERFAVNLMQGVIQATPPTSCFSSTHYSSSSRFSSSPSPISPDKLKNECLDQGNSINNGARSSFFSGPLSGVRSQGVEKHHRRVSSLNKSLMNQYFCFGAQDLAVEDSVNSIGTSRSCRHLVF